MRNIAVFPLTGASGYLDISRQGRESQASGAKEASAARPLYVSGSILPVLPTCPISVGGAGEFHALRDKEDP